MAKNILVISCDIRETRAALIENGIIAELHIERKGRQSSTVGNVYLGKVTRVLPGLQAAFVDIGQERAAFLHVEDLIRPDDFDEYLAGGRNLARKEGAPAHDDAAEEVVDDESALLAAPQAGPQIAPPIGPEAEPVRSALEAEIVVDIERDAESAPGSELEAPSSEGPSSDALSSETRPSEAPSSETRSSETRPSETRSSVPPLPMRADDLETTVSYPNWPHPPSGRARDAAVSQPHPPNGATDVTSALGESDEPGPLDEELGEDADDESLPPAAEVSSIELSVSLSSSVSGAALPPEEDSSEEIVVARADDSHSFHSAPTLDELPEDEEDSSDRPSAVLVDAGTDEEDDDLPTVGEDDDLPGFTISEPGEPVPRAPAPRAADRGERGGRRRRGRRRGGPAVGGAPGGGAAAGGAGPSEGRTQARGRGGEPRRDSRDQRDQRSGRGGGSGDRRGGGRGGQGMPGRISKSTPIREVVKEGQEIIVQVTKDPIGTKGARCSSHISLPGRYVVYLPTVDHVGISKRIGNDKERARLREAIEAMKPPHGGLIVRTVAEGLTKKGLKQDVGYLVRLWGEIAKKREGARSPNCLSSELDLVLKVARDLFTDEVDEVVVDDRQQYERLRSFVEMFAPDRLKDVKFYDEDEPIFDEYGIEDEIGRALSRKVPLPSGGYLIIDQAEALAAIDVNTGRFVGKGSKDMEETILKTNLEAVHEIAYQLRFRNIGGLIILDLIDMELHKNRETVRRTLEELLQKDKAKTTLNRISELGLIEMTRKRTRESLSRLMHEPCFYCDGTGQLQSKETIAYEILREIRRKKSTLPGYSVVVNAHPAVADVLNGNEKQSLAEAENRFQRKIIVVPRKEYHLEQFDLQGK